jgi:hypothetical protein
LSVIPTLEELSYALLKRKRLVLVRKKRLHPLYRKNCLKNENQTTEKIKNCCGEDGKKMKTERNK